MRTARKRAAARGQSFPEFVADALADKIGKPPPKMPKAAAMAGEKPWMKHFGALKEYAEELEEVKQVIEEDCERINPDDWK